MIAFGQGSHQSKDKLLSIQQQIQGQYRIYKMGSDTVKHHADYTNFTKSLSSDTNSTTKKREYLQQLIDSYEALSTGQTNWVCNLANCSSLLWYTYQEALETPINWSGFYLIDPKIESQLILGPFMGKVACQTIQFGKGVCGAAADTLKSQVVPNVELFPGHIACDGETRSEIVIPIINEQTGLCQGVLDIDCLIEGGFDDVDREMLEKLCTLISKTCEW